MVQILINFSKYLSSLVHIYFIFSKYLTSMVYIFKLRYNPLTFFLFKISNFISPPRLTSCLTPAGGSNPAGQLPEVS